MIKMPEIFQNGMMLQREMPVRIWGCAEPGEEVKAEIQGKSASSVAGTDGRWCITMQSLDASENEMLVIRAGDEVLTIEDIAVGEVWLAGGQSNMEYHMRYEKHLDEVKPTCADRNIRFFDVPEVAYPGQRDDFDYSRMGIWRKAGPDDIEYFTAVGYYFARALKQDLDVPVGIVGCNWGGTTSSAWMDPATIEKVGKPWMDDFRARTAEMDMDEYWQKQHTNFLNDRGNPFADAFSEFMMPKTRTPEEIGEFFSKMAGEVGSFLNEMQPPAVPGALYENMLKTIAPYTCRGVLWYQGESDDEEGHPDIYGDMLNGLIGDWRKVMQNDSLTFLVVQLPGWERWLQSENMHYDLVREGQQKVADSVGNVWLCSISDAGEQFDIHPKNKVPAGERLALLARGHVYGEDILCDAPRAADITRDGNILGISFTGADGGLEIRGGQLEAMDISCNEKAIDFSAAVDGENLIIRLAEECDGSVNVIFAKRKWYLVNLYNKAGIPAVPFAMEV